MGGTVDGVEEGVAWLWIMLRDSRIFPSKWHWRSSTSFFMQSSSLALIERILSIISLNAVRKGVQSVSNPGVSTSMAEMNMENRALNFLKSAEQSTQSRNSSNWQRSSWCSSETKKADCSSSSMRVASDSSFDRSSS